MGVTVCRVDKGAQVDPNATAGILVIAAAALFALQWFLRPYQARYLAKKKLIAEAKQKRIEELAAEQLARKYKKKGRL